MQEMTMVERVAKSIYEVSPFRDAAGEYDEQSEIYRRMCRLFARAAIEAMREATDRMADDGYRAMHYGADAVWQAMIDAALSE